MFGSGENRDFLAFEVGPLDCVGLLRFYSFFELKKRRASY